MMDYYQDGKGGGKWSREMVNGNDGINYHTRETTELQQIYQPRNIKMHPIIFLPLLLTLTLAQQYQACQNNGTSVPESQICLCPQAFIGKNCSIPATKLAPSQTRLEITNNFTFVYLQPKQVQLFRFVLTFCLEDPQANNLELLIFGQQEAEDGELSPMPVSARQIMSINLGAVRECVSIYSSVVSSQMKGNGDVARIVFGVMRFKGAKEVDNQASQFITIKCETDSLFSASFFIVVLGSFMVTSIIVAIVSVIFFILRRRRQRSRTTQTQKSRQDTINKLMPIKKYETLIQQSQPSSIQNDQEQKTCAICLCDFKAGQPIRKTPCSHIYHDSCLDNWCHAHFNCPVCRKSFEDQCTDSQLEQLPAVLRNHGNNIRIGIL